MTTPTQIWRDIRALPYISTSDMLDIIQALRGKLPAACLSPEAEALDSCAMALQDSISDMQRESDAADWMASREERAQVADGAVLSAIPRFLSTAI